MSTRIMSETGGGAQEANAPPPAAANGDDTTRAYGASRSSTEEAGGPYERAAKRSCRVPGSKKHLIPSTPSLCRAYAARVTAAIERTDAARNLEDARRKLREAEARDAAAAARVKEADDELVLACGYPWGERDETWVGGYAGLLRYRDEHGHCTVPVKYAGAADDEGRNEQKVHLGRWVSRQRYGYNTLERGEGAQAPSSRNPLYPWRRSLLENARFDWGTKLGKRAKTWEDHYADLLEHKRLHGHVDVPQTLENQDRTNGSMLARWVRYQRKNYKDAKAGKVGTGMTEERIRLLEEVGFSWRKKKYASRRSRGGGRGNDVAEEEDEEEEEEEGSDDEGAEDETDSTL